MLKNIECLLCEIACMQKPSWYSGVRTAYGRLALLLPRSIVTSSRHTSVGRNRIASFSAQHICRDHTPFHKPHSFRQSGIFFSDFRVDPGLVFCSYLDTYIYHCKSTLVAEAIAHAVVQLAHRSRKGGGSDPVSFGRAFASISPHW